MKALLQAMMSALFVLSAVQTAGAQGAHIDNATCLGCHGTPGFATTGANARSLYVAAQPLAHSVHGSLPCVACHTTITEIPHKNAALTPAEWRRQIPKLCGNCHTNALTDYTRSVHGKAVMSSSNVYAAVCTDCHTAHAVARPQLAATRRAITKECGNCHAAALASYTATYHGQIVALGYANVATCADCHRGHAILPESDPSSSVSPAKMLGTCRTCHQDATAGFATFEAHATTDNFARYPYTWIASKFVWMLIIVTFAVFWISS